MHPQQQRQQHQLHLQHQQHHQQPQFQASRLLEPAFQFQQQHHQQQPSRDSYHHLASAAPQHGGRSYVVFGGSGGSGESDIDFVLQREDKVRSELKAKYETREEKLKAEFAVREEKMRMDFAAREATLKAEHSAREDKLQEKIALLTEEVSLGRRTLSVGASASIRNELENFADAFQFNHISSSKNPVKCQIDLTDRSTTMILHHYATCTNIYSKEQLLGADLSAALTRRGIRQGSLAKAVSDLWNAIHNATITIDRKHVLPTGLTISNQRFLVRFLQDQGDDVLIAQEKGLPRPPTQYEMLEESRRETSQAALSMERATSELF